MRADVASRVTAHLPPRAIKHDHPMTDNPEERAIFRRNLVMRRFITVSAGWSGRMVRVNTSSASIESAAYVHPSALCESDDIGDGTRIWAFAHIMPGAVIGCDCNICDQVFVEGGARIGARVTVKNQVMVWDGVTVEDDAFLGPGMIFTNDLHPRSARMPQVVDRYRRRENWLVPTTVGRGASIGAGAVILCGVAIGPYSMIGAGAVVVSDAPAHRLFVGQPAKGVGWVCTCGMRLDSSLQCPACGQSHTLRDDLKHDGWKGVAFGLGDLQSERY